MSDLADRADWVIQAEIAASRAKIQQQVRMTPTGYCFYCDEAVTELKRFCDVDCRDDFERERIALHCAGLRR